MPITSSAKCSAFPSPPAPAHTTSGRKCSTPPAGCASFAPTQSLQPSSSLPRSSIFSDVTAFVSASLNCAFRALKPRSFASPENMIRRLWKVGIPDPTMATPFSRRGASARPMAKCCAGESEARTESWTMGTFALGLMRSIGMKTPWSQPCK